MQGYVAQDYVATLRLLLRDPRVAADARSIHGQLVLWVACNLGFTRLARVLLLEGGVDHTVFSSEGRTAVEAARHKGHKGCVQLLQVSGRVRSGRWDRG